MEQKEWRKEGKEEWGPGPWQEEPDQVQWVDDKTGLSCIARRSMRGGNWCGYVGVAEGHLAYGQNYNDVYRVTEDDRYIDVHGGLTYSAFCEGEPGDGICHLPGAGEPDKVWWLGFDCAHLYDKKPGGDKKWEEPTASYRTLGYVKRQCESLAEQLAGPLKIEKRD